MQDEVGSLPGITPERDPSPGNNIHQAPDVPSGFMEPARTLTTSPHIETNRTTKCIS
jgi:hypothetical protein